MAATVTLNRRARLSVRLASALDRAGYDTRGILVHQLLDAKSILEVGCGTGAALRRIELRARPIGVDTFLPDLLQAQNGQYADVLLADGSYLPFSDGAFDVVLAVSVLEHLTKTGGERLLQEIERVAIRKILIITPNGFVPQGHKDMNPYQTHLSGWNRRELSARGYQVFGVGGMKGLRGDFGRPRLHPQKVWNAFARASQLVIQWNPWLSFELAGVKQLDGGKRA